MKPVMALRAEPPAAVFRQEITDTGSQASVPGLAAIFSEGGTSRILSGTLCGLLCKVAKKVFEFLGSRVSHSGERRCTPTRPDSCIPTPACAPPWS